jgi:carboxymethylenebutenolidase
MKTVSFVTLAAAVAFGSGASVFAQNPLEPAKPNVSFAGPRQGGRGSGRPTDGFVAGPGGLTLHGYLALPGGSGQAPGVLMIHEWWGLNRDTALLADALAREGFVVLAADAFRGRVAQDPDAARKQVSETPPEQIAADLDAALDFLRTLPRVDPQRVASLGFCFGGTQSMYMGTRNPELAAVVIFYGGGPIQDVKQLGSMREAGPVLGIYGEQDPSIPSQQVRAFQNALEAAGVRNTITVYPGVGHAFVKSNTYQDGGAAQKAWQQMLRFLKENLQE